MRPLRPAWVSLAAQEHPLSVASPLLAGKQALRFQWSWEVLMLKRSQNAFGTNPAAEQRQHTRIPYFGTLDLRSSDGQQSHSVYSLDASRSGLGFCHQQPIHGPFEVQLPTVLGRSVQCTANTVWTRRYAEGWLVSGARFSKVLRREWAELQVASAAAVFKRRSNTREPFFGHVEFRYLTDFSTETALSRDLSATGIGLIQCNAPRKSEAVIRFQHYGDLREVRAFLVWSKQVDDGFFLSGWKFAQKRLMLEEIV